MAQEQDQPNSPDFTADETGTAPVRRWRWRVILLALAVVLVVLLGSVWVMRKDIADNLISGQLDSLGLPSKYEITSIGPSEQVVRNLVIGDPHHPDLTVDELRVATRLHWGLPGLGRITVVRPRLYGNVRHGKVSFGSLDKVLFTGKGGPFEMPGLDVAIVDGRALVETDGGRIGVKLKGAGPLRDGFKGELAAVAPELVLAGCKARRVSVYGSLSTAAQKPHFQGPLRLQHLTCEKPDLAIARAGLSLDVTVDKTLDGAEGKLGLKTGAGRLAQNRLQGASGTADFTYHGRALNARYDLTARGVMMPQARLASLSFDGRARSVEGFSRFDIEGDLGGKGITLGQEIDRALADARDAGAGTMVAPLAGRMRLALAGESRGSTLSANLIVRRTDEGLSVVVPRGSLRGGSGSSLLTISRVQAMFADGDVPRITGNFATGGRGLPRISGRMESGQRGRLAMHISMPEYSAGGASIALPQLSLVQDTNGTLAFRGRAGVTGDLPGGRAENLVLPIEGRWSANGALAMWPRCTQVTFDRLQFANLKLDKRSLPVCPASGGAIVRSDGSGMHIAAGVPSLDLAGQLGATPIRIGSGPLGYAKNGDEPGAISAKALDIELGPAESASQFLIADLDATVGESIGGSFDGADIGLYAVPLDMKQAAGSWGYSGGILSIGDASFVLVDRQKASRFKPMIARDANLRLHDNIITAQALIREPDSDREVVRTAIVHDLSTGTGHADLTVDGIRFDDKLQADALSSLALGVVSNLEGKVRGSGRIDWNNQGVSSRGSFSTDSLDFAAAFGPVRGLSGKIVFTDLLGLVTAPDQILHIASVNPGIEVTDGTFSFEMKPDYYLQINGARWPFMSGTLVLEPAHMKIGVAETRYYTLRVIGLDATTFVRHLDLSNLNATGVFDGQLPLIFDENGGRIENGHLVSRPPGGNVAYVGELTYKDLSAMGNFAFDTLKSVDYKSMEITLGGELAGEIITRVSFTGLSQGVGAKRNFLTKQVAKLPIRFVLNIKAPFFSLFAPLRSLYDPSYVTDPRTLGLIGTDGRPKILGQQDIPAAAIQPSVSENNP
ncbi:intermembrane phospholipid transport protein YdbH family protein [Novosphingobium malaysiense]|uniref:C4-dicarboxylate ABC transporter n=1 Tax=Novosphingobium malaysiense TaxID=1348853 RepID=A0A0B1ZRP8_9SPHN|nr:YdbH domain-containing protein [Novosphingobium malaysiense]KHK91913.1 C4-dicarboxylate ABC transporter [Novosphingobium malaysiense]